MVGHSEIGDLFGISCNGSWQYASYHKRGISSEVSLCSFDVIVLTDHLTDPQEVLALHFVVLTTALKFLNADMNGNPLFIKVR
ncbi:hypothetical protein DWX95_05520 [Butyricicoccus sp. AF22-28AC]|nr:MULTISPECIES: hypothetical protein [unclassified Butyricicoccus]RGM80083.1 hypothetical protein DXB94_01405 [Butyricicoccus sp. OM06-6AC]RHQ82903.1 hypothetical protein DWX95_05520 [Butyricicoccus sp. AF22-28AC]